MQNLRCSSQRKDLAKKVEIVSKKVWTFLPLLWYFCVLTGGADHEKYHKGIMARKRHAARGRQTQHSRDATAAGIYQQTQR